MKVEPSQLIPRKPTENLELLTVGNWRADTKVDSWPLHTIKRMSIV